MSLQSLEERPIQEEHQVFLQNNQEFRQDFIRTGCVAFINIYGQVHPNLVREFYSHYRYADSKVTFVMFGTTYVWTLEKFAEVLRVSSSGMDFCNLSTNLWNLKDPRFGPGFIVRNIASKWISLPMNGNLNLAVSELKKPYEHHLKVIRKNVLGTEAAGRLISCSEAIMIFAMNQGHKINAAKVIAVRMNGAAQSRYRPLLYPTLLNRVFYEIGVLGKREGSYDLSTDPVEIPRTFGRMRSGI